MDYYKPAGLDCSIRDIASLDVNGYVIISGKTSLSLKSTMPEIKDKALTYATALNEECITHLYVDYTFFPYVARAKQTAINTMFIAMIATAFAGETIPIEPSAIRRHVGLKGRASKEQVWDAYLSIKDIMGLKTEHEKDALVLALYGRDIYLGAKPYEQ